MICWRPRGSEKLRTSLCLLRKSNSSFPNARRRQGTFESRLTGARAHPRSSRESVMMTLPILLSSCLLMAQPRVSPPSPVFYLSGPEIVKFAASFGSAAASNETLEQMSRLCNKTPTFKPSDLMAFEENRSFVYAVGSVSEADRNFADSRPDLRREPAFRRVRRLIFLKPSTFVVDDQLEAASSTSGAQWLLFSRTKPAVSGQFARAFDEDSELLCETLLPQRPIRQIRQQPRGVEQAQGYVLRLESKEASRAVRFLSVLQVRRARRQRPSGKRRVGNSGRPTTFDNKDRSTRFQSDLASVSDGCG